ncbi:MAG: DUF4423 domain-containing protein [Acidobacteriales bacterium]|nr:DUF4423 domain-containing protein [Terriglobales bacterium]
MANGMFRDRLAQEFRARREKNPRFSLRGFAALLNVDHSTLSQILRGCRRASANQMQCWAHSLGMDREEALVYEVAEHVPDSGSRRRQEQLRHWTAEAFALLDQPAHFEILRLVRSPGLRPDCRWLARQIGISVDELNIALSRLLRLRLLAVENQAWKVTDGLPKLTSKAFRELALERARQMTTA